MRCLTLAEALKERGAAVGFICRELPGNLIGLLEDMGYQVARLPQPEVEFVPAPDDPHHASWLGVHWVQDAGETVAVLGGEQLDWLVIDSYAIDLRWERELRPLVGRIMVIDDLADRPHDCDLLLDQNLYYSAETRYDGLVPQFCQQLLGPRYALLRTEFAQAQEKLRPRDGQVHRVLVFFGGADPTSETERTLTALANVPQRHFEVDVVVGAGKEGKKGVLDFCSHHPGFYYHCQINNMAELMLAADLAIGAGGSTTWERCSMGLPSITVVIADNQEATTKALADLKATVYLGRSSEVDSGLLTDAVKHLLDHPGLVKEIGDNAYQLMHQNAEKVSSVVEAVLGVCHA